MKDKFLSSLGLARRAGAVSVGAEAVLKSIRSRRAALVFAAKDISAQSFKKLATSTEYYNVPLKRVDYTMAELSEALGVTHNVAACSVHQSTIVNLFLQ